MSFGTFIVANCIVSRSAASLASITSRNDPTAQKCRDALASLGKLVTERPVDFVGFDNVVEFNKNRQNDDIVVKAYKDLFS